MEAQWAKTERKTGRPSPSPQGEDSSGRVCREKDTQSARRRRKDERFMVAAAVLVGGGGTRISLLTGV